MLATSQDHRRGMTTHPTRTPRRGRRMHPGARPRPDLPEGGQGGERTPGDTLYLCLCLIFVALSVWFAVQIVAERSHSRKIAEATPYLRQGAADPAEWR